MTGRPAPHLRGARSAGFVLGAPENKTMNSKPLIMIGVVVGSTLGGMVPLLWGAGWPSFSSIITSTIGGLLGILVGVKMSAYL